MSNSMAASPCLKAMAFCIRSALLVNAASIASLARFLFASANWASLSMSTAACTAWRIPLNASLSCPPTFTVKLDDERFTAWLRSSRQWHMIPFLPSFAYWRPM